MPVMLESLSLPSDSFELVNEVSRHVLVATKIAAGTAAIIGLVAGKRFHAYRVKSLFAY